MEQTTKQFKKRNAIYECLCSTDTHPSAEMVHEMLHAEHPDISLATVYNCIESLAAQRLINQLHFDNGPCRFCPNVEPHVHVMDDASNRVLDDNTNRVIDVQLKEGLSPEDVFELPEGVHIKSMEAYLRGEIPENCMSENEK